MLTPCISHAGMFINNKSYNDVNDLNNRYLNTKIGRFTTVDPKQEFSSHYSYVNGLVIINSDPTGLGAKEDAEKLLTAGEKVLKAMQSGDMDNVELNEELDTTEMVEKEKLSKTKGEEKPADKDQASGGVIEPDSQPGNPSYDSSDYATVEYHDNAKDTRKPYHDNVDGTPESDYSGAVTVEKKPYLFKHGMQFDNSVQLTEYENRERWESGEIANGTRTKRTTRVMGGNEYIRVDGTVSDPDNETTEIFETDVKYKNDNWGYALGTGIGLVGAGGLFGGLYYLLHKGD